MDEPLVQTILDLLSQATDHLAAGLMGAKAGLYNQNIPVTPTTTLAALVAALPVFTGYATKAITWGTPSIADDGTVEVLGTLAAWAPTDAVNPDTIFGAYICDSTSTNLLQGGLFVGAPLPMIDTTSRILLTLRYRPGAGPSLMVVTS